MYNTVTYYYNFYHIYKKGDWGEGEMNHLTGVSIKITRQQIEKKREEMIELAATYGINSKVTIQCSQELDLLLNRLDIKLYNKKSA